MKTFIVNKDFRLSTHFYSQPESGRKIQLMFDNDKCYEHFKTMFTLVSFDLFCIQSYMVRKIQKFNLYKNCKVLTKGTHQPTNNLGEPVGKPQYFIMFQCEKIIMDIPENIVAQRIRKEKLTNIKQITL